MSTEMMELISTLAPLIFYALVACVAIGLAIYKIVIKVKKGEDVSTDIDSLTTAISEVLTKKFTKLSKKNGVSVDSTTVANTLTATTKAILNSSSQLDNKNEEVK